MLCCRPCAQTKERRLDLWVTSSALTLLYLAHDTGSLLLVDFFVSVSLSAIFIPIYTACMHYTNMCAPALSPYPPLLAHMLNLFTCAYNITGHSPTMCSDGNWNVVIKESLKSSLGDWMPSHLPSQKKCMMHQLQVTCLRIVLIMCVYLYVCQCVSLMRVCMYAYVQRDMPMCRET